MSDNNMIDRISYIFSPFFDDKDSIEIKKFINRIRSSSEFSKMKINVVQFSDFGIKKRFKLDKSDRSHLFREFVRPSVGGCYSDVDDKIFIYVDNYVRPIRLSKREKDKTFTRIIQGIFHEYRHRVQYRLRHKEDFNLIFCDISRFVLGYRDKIDYLSKHDSFFIEIDANNYGVNKTIEYFNNHPEMIRYYNERDLDMHKYMYEYDQCVYDFDKEWSYYNVLREMIPFEDLKRKIRRDKDKVWHNVLYGDKKRLKTIEDIVNHEDFDKLDNRFINYIFTSRYFNKQLNYSSLNRYLVKFLLNQFEFRREELLLKIDYVRNNKIESEDRKRRDLSRFVKDLQYYDSKILELTALLVKVKSK